MKYETNELRESAYKRSIARAREKMNRKRKERLEKEKEYTIEIWFQESQQKLHASKDL